MQPIIINGIHYCLLKDSSFSQKDVVELLHVAFEDRVKNGMNFLPARITLEQYNSRIIDSFVVIAYKNNVNELLGSSSISIKKNKENIIHGDLFDVAIKPGYSRNGIASNIYQQIEEIALEHNCEYIISNTATAAKSSILYHLKNGFKIIGYLSHSTTNYYSYLFRKQLKHPSTWDSKLYCKVQFLKGYIKTKFTKRVDGSPTTIALIISSTKKRIWIPSKNKQ